MDWIILFRDQTLENHPVLYTIALLSIGICILYFVFENERKLNKKHKNRPWDPFRKR